MFASIQGRGRYEDDDEDYEGDLTPREQRKRLREQKAAREMLHEEEQREESSKRQSSSSSDSLLVVSHGGRRDNSGRRSEEIERKKTSAELTIGSTAAAFLNKQPLATIKEMIRTDLSKLRTMDARNKKIAAINARSTEITRKEESKEMQKGLEVLKNLALTNKPLYRYLMVDIAGQQGTGDWDTEGAYPRLENAYAEANMAFIEAEQRRCALHFLLTTNKHRQEKRAIATIVEVNAEFSATQTSSADMMLPFLNPDDDVANDDTSRNYDDDDYDN